MSEHTAESSSVPRMTFQQIYDKHHNAMTMYAASLLQDAPGEVEDLMQDVYFAVFRNMDHIGQMNDVGARVYLMKTVENAAWKFRQRTLPLLKRQEPLDESVLYKLADPVDILGDICADEGFRILINLIQTTLSGFTRSASRRMDAELCILELCQPELSLDAKALNARITRLEEQLKNGSFVAVASSAKPKKEVPEDYYDDERPPIPDDADAPPPEDDLPPAPMPSEEPVGFWSELCGNIRKELRPPVSGFFAPSPSSPLQGALVGNTLELRCSNDFIAKMLDKPDILEVVARKAGAILNRPVRVQIVDLNAKPMGNPRMEQLMQFGREHSDIIKIKNH